MADPHGPMKLRIPCIIAGPLIAVLVYALLGTSGLEHDTKAVAGIGVWMAFWWMTEAIPLAATSLMPLVLFPLAGVMSLKSSGGSYAHPLVVLFMGGFILGLAVERWGLHKRVALATVLAVGTKPSTLIAGFMLATAVLSMFISNTATAIMLLPIAMSVIGLLDRLHDDEGGMGINFPAALLLGIAYASSIGGVSTITGTQPNLLLIGFLDDLDIKIGWAQWLGLGLPMCAIMLPLAWLILTKVSLPVRVDRVPGVRGYLKAELCALGRVGRGEWIIITVFSLVSVGWMSRVYLTKAFNAGGYEWIAGRIDMLGDPGIAMLGALALFAIPVYPSKRQFAMDWATAKKMPWDVLLLFGGGLALASAMKASGLDVAIGNSLSGLRGVPPVVLVLVVSLTVIFLTELTSNTATTAAFVPILGTAAPALGVHPVLLMVPAGIVASYAFMLPVATPPNAIVFGSGRLTIPQMARAGLLLNITGVIVTTLIVSQFGAMLLGLDLNLPAAAGD
jgi:sodium-dependent dicarboxylate transporter 2/3/5